MAHELFLDILEDVNNNYPRNRGADIVAKQVLRACSSIGANISEGFGRSQKRFSNCLDIAKGEANETENWLYKVRYAGFTVSERVTKQLKMTIRVEKMLGSLKKRVEDYDKKVREHPPQYKIWPPQTN